MVLIMDYYVDGGCRRNGRPDAIGAAAVARRYRNGRVAFRADQLDDYYYSATSQRAEILAIILALEWAMDDYEKTDTSPRLSITIHSDSRYAVGCMNKWLYKWSNNGWINSAGNSVANQDILQDVINAENRVLEVGTVEYKWVSRDQVHDADKRCNELLDQMW